MDALQSSKLQLRKAVQGVLKGIPEADVLAQSSRVHDRLFLMPEYQRAKNISVYLSMPSGEVSTARIVRHALRHGETVFVPFIHKNATSSPRSLMDMVALHSEADYESLKPDKWGIPTPDAATVSERARCLCRNFAAGKDKVEKAGLELAKLDLVILPGVAFDRSLKRLGHGKGYYDFFLSQYRESTASQAHGTRMPYLVGIALDQQVLPEGEIVPTDNTDWPLDKLLYSKGSIP